MYKQTIDDYDNEPEYLMETSLVGFEAGVEVPDKTAEQLADKTKHKCAINLWVVNPETGEKYAA